jgi:sulfide:quinone oxidoreductase
MSNILILGGGFSGVVAAERLAKKLGPEHQITMVSQADRFIFYPALVRLAFGRAEPDDLSFDLREAMLDRRVRFIHADVASIDPWEHKVTVTGDEVKGKLGYDYVVCALGRRLATDQIPGFFEFSHHLLSVDGALKFGEAIRNFHSGHAVIGNCPGSRLVVPALETAFALAQHLDKRGDRERVKITLVSNESLSDQLGGPEVESVVRDSITANQIDLLSDFPISRVTSRAIQTSNKHDLKYDMLMLVPPFKGTGAVTGTGLTDKEGFLHVDSMMRVLKTDRMYAAGDCVAFSGPKMGHMAVRQAEVVADNIIADIDGRLPAENYDHELKYVIDASGDDSIFFHKNLWTDDDVTVRQGRFWSWAKRAQEKYWEALHS